MANIRVDVDYTIFDGVEVVFKAPCNCADVTGLKIYYPDADGIETSQVFQLSDAHCNNIGTLDELFAEGAVVKVILDTNDLMAFVQNADTNAYLEGRLVRKLTTYTSPTQFGVSVDATPSEIWIALPNPSELSVNKSLLTNSAWNFPSTDGVVIVRKVDGNHRGYFEFNGKTSASGNTGNDYRMHLTTDGVPSCIWEKQANINYAVNKAGDTMTGDLVISKDNIIQSKFLQGDPTKMHRYTDIYHSDGAAWARLRIQTIDSSGAKVPVSHQIVILIQDELDTNFETYTILHSGNYPFGSGAGFHNSIYRGKYLGTAVTDAQWAEIADGTFDDLYIGDYWTIGGINYRIAAFDYYYNTGDTACTKHHVVIVPDTNMYTHVMNDTNITTGAYVGSKMYTEGLTQAKTTINNAFGSAHILNHRQYLNNAVTDGYPSGGSWYDSTVELMTEQNVYGGKVFGGVINGTAWPYNYTVDKSQYPLFAMRPDMISNRQWFWLRDVASATGFADVYTNGLAHNNYASGAGGVRPAFSIS